MAESAAGALVAHSARLRIAGTYAGTWGGSEDEEIVRMVRASAARLLLVAFGSPAQEYWIARNLPRLGPCVAIGVGGTFDYLAGRIPRAPGIVRAAGFEWLYRLLQQPWRWRRQLALPLFVYLVLRQRVAQWVHA